VRTSVMRTALLRRAVPTAWRREGSFAAFQSSVRRKANAWTTENPAIEGAALNAAGIRYQDNDKTVVVYFRGAW